jgi:hypothetical protein
MNKVFTNQVDNKTFENLMDKPQKLAEFHEHVNKINEKLELANINKVSIKEALRIFDDYVNNIKDLEIKETLQRAYDIDSLRKIVNLI